MFNWIIKNWTFSSISFTFIPNNLNLFLRSTPTPVFFYEGNRRHILLWRWVMSSFDSLNVCYRNKVIYGRIKNVLCVISNALYKFYVLLKTINFVKIEANYFQTFNDIRSKFLNKQYSSKFLKNWMTRFRLVYLNKNTKQNKEEKNVLMLSYNVYIQFQK